METKEAEVRNAPLERPEAPRIDAGGTPAFAALETLAKVLHEAAEKQARADAEVNEWREKYETGVAEGSGGRGKADGTERPAK